MSGDGGRMDSGVAFGRARGGPGRTALASRFPHRPAARRESALEPRLAAWLGGGRGAGRSRDDSVRPTRLPVIRGGDGVGRVGHAGPTMCIYTSSYATRDPMV